MSETSDATCGFFDRASEDQRYYDIGAVENTDGEVTFFDLQAPESTTRWITADSRAVIDLEGDR